MTTYSIPLTSAPQSLEVRLAGTDYVLTLRWNDSMEGGWVLDIGLPDGAGYVLCGVPLVTGVDLLEPHAHLGVGGSLIVWSDAHDAPPGRSDLGSGVDLLFVAQDEEDA